MPVSLYLDVHVPRAIRDQLRRRGVDVLTAQEDKSTQRTDEELLERASNLGRLLITQDIRFKALAEDWQRIKRPFAGLLFAHQSTELIGKYVIDLELVAKASDPLDWANVVERLPI